MDLKQISGRIEAHKQLSGRDGGQNGVRILLFRCGGRYDRRITTTAAPGTLHLARVPGRGTLLQCVALLLLVLLLGLIESAILGPVVRQAQIGTCDLEQPNGGGMPVDLEQIVDPLVLEQLLGIGHVARGDPHGVSLLALLVVDFTAVFLAILQQLGGLGRRAAEVGAGSGTAPAIASPKSQIVRLPVVAVLVVEADAEGSLPNELVGRPGPLLGQYARK